MDYYEELGVSPLAGEAEIRRSYKRLTLLLHPDQQLDPELRAMAEGQMKRLNEMVEILTNPERRRAYNEGLRQTSLLVRQPPPVRWGTWVRNNLGWVLVGLAFVIVLVSALLVPTFDSARTVAKAHEPAPGTAYPTSTRASEKALEFSLRKPSKESPPQQRVIERRMSDADWKPAPGLPSLPENVHLPAASVEKPVPQATVAPPAQTSAQAAPLPVPPAQTVPSTPRAAPTLAGRWVYTPDPHDSEDPKLFPAEYVELSIFLAGNTLRGAYQSRYKLSDRRLNSHVNFTFQGPATASSFTWQGDSGAQGEITMRLESADTLKVSWFATAMGSALSLGSGSATVYRFR